MIYFIQGLARGGRCGVAACVFWFVAAVSVWKVPRAEQLSEVGNTRQSIITTETILPGGTKKIETKRLYEPEI